MTSSIDLAGLANIALTGTPGVTGHLLACFEFGEVFSSKRMDEKD